LDKPVLSDASRHEVATSLRADPEAGRLDELRELLLAPEQAQLERLSERLDDPALYAQEVSRVLPDAIRLGAKEGGAFTSALAPIMTNIIMVAVKRDLRAFADALFPVIGPAIRRAVAETFKQMLQSLNQTLERSFSWQGLKWRLEAHRTGKPFAEVVLLHSLIYRVEQVFLIHRQSGVLLQHVAVEGEAFQDADLVSGMLTAIQDFISDSFDVAADQALDSIQFGDFCLWVVQGPEAVIACAIRGNAPEELRIFLREALEKIHLEQGDALDAFEGDPSPFEPARYHLTSCLQARYEKKEKKFLLVLGLLGVSAIVLMGLWIFVAIRDHQRWTAYLQQLKAEPGIVVTEAFDEGGIYRVSGLRDPMAKKPMAILATAGLDPHAVVHHFQPYQALSPGFVLERARRALRPPATLRMSFGDGVLKVVGAAPYDWVHDARKLAPALPGVVQFDDAGLAVDIDLTSLDAPQSVSLEMRNGELRASGSAPYRWVIAARKKAPVIPGVFRYDDSGLRIEPDLSGLVPPNTVILSLKDGVLRATGTASHSWMVAARQQVSLIPGITEYDDSSLQDMDYAALMALKKQLEQVLVLFGSDATQGDENDLGQVLSDVKRLIGRAQAAGKHVSIEVIGHADSSGSYLHNLNLSQARAESVRGYLVTRGIKSKYISAWGAGADDRMKKERSEQERQMKRSVTFKVWLSN
jgi:outer membrane protein OmpA-like peptidoglycan-associated protein